MSASNILEENSEWVNDQPSLLMLESRSCECASLGEGWEGDYWLVRLELAGAVPFSLSPRSQFILFLSLQGQQQTERGRRW